MARRLRGRAIASPGYIDADAYLNERGRFYDQILRRPMRRRAAGWSPRIDIVEREEEIVVKVDLPGMSREDIDLSVRGNVLVISGERKEGAETGRAYYCRECRYGGFRRTVTIPPAVDIDKIDASYKEGVLEVVMPKKEEAKGKKIEITGE